MAQQNKDEQKKLLIEIMEADQKNGLYQNQTAVEWIINELRQLAFNEKTHLGMGDVRVTQGLIDELEEEAKQMEKEQIIDAYCIGKYINVDDREFGEQYYNETYGKDNTGI